MTQNFATKEVAKSRPGIDPITVEIIGSSLSSITEEMGKALIKAAYSDNIKIRIDCSAAIFDAQGRTIAQAEHIPLHLGSLFGIIDYIFENYDLSDIQPGDVFIGNDAYEGGSTHLQDVVLAEPVFYDGKIFAWVVNTAHHVDWVNLRHTHIFEEGLRIPPIRLYRAGVEQKDIFKLILTNCQLPHHRVGDLRAQMACNNLGARRLTALVDKYGEDITLAAIEEVLNYAERRTRLALSAIPAGHYIYSAKFDTDMVEKVFDLHIAIEVGDGNIHFDFSGCPPQVAAPINSILNGTKAMIYYSLKTMTEKELLPNSGFFRCVQVTAPAGSVFNCRSPAPVYYRQDLLARMVDMIYAALADVIPSRVIAASTGAAIATLSGTDPKTGEFFVYNETIGGGWGARSTKDGWDAMTICCGNGMNMPVELLEAGYPIRVERYELVKDSGGAGQFRGGMSARRLLRMVDHDSSATIGAPSRVAAPFGLKGAMAGSPSVIEVGEGVTKLDARQWAIRSGCEIGVVPAGGGGFGLPLSRDRELVRKDLREERISAQAALEVYGLDAADIAEIERQRERWQQ